MRRSSGAPVTCASKQGSAAGRSAVGEGRAGAAGRGVQEGWSMGWMEGNIPALNSRGLIGPGLGPPSAPKTQRPTAFPPRGAPFRQAQLQRLRGKNGRVHACAGCGRVRGWWHSPAGGRWPRMLGAWWQSPRLALGLRQGRRSPARSGWRNRAREQAGSGRMAAAARAARAACAGMNTGTERDAGSGAAKKQDSKCLACVGQSRVAGIHRGVSARHGSRTGMRGGGRGPGALRVPLRLAGARGAVAGNHGGGRGVITAQGLEGKVQVGRQAGKSAQKAQASGTGQNNGSRKIPGGR